MLEDDRPHFFRHLGPQWWERRGEAIAGDVDPLRGGGVDVRHREPTPGGLTLPSHRDPPFSPVLALDVPIEDRVGITLLEADGVPHVVTNIDLRYLASMRVGPIRTTARILRADDALAQLWVEVRDLGTGRLMTHVVADAIPRDAFRVR